MPLSITLLDDSTTDGVHWYAVKITEGDREWTVHRRFSEFVRLDADLADLKLGATPRLSLPPKDIMGMRRRLRGADVFDSQRREGLQEYIKDVVARASDLGDWRELPTLKQFLTDPETPATNDHPLGRREVSKGNSPRQSYSFNLLRRSKSPEPEAATASFKAASATSSSAGTLILVLKPLTRSGEDATSPLEVARRQLRTHLGSSPGLVVSPVAFCKGSPLENYDVFSVSASSQALLEFAERQRMQKKVVLKAPAAGRPSDNFVQHRGRRPKHAASMPCWRKFSTAHIHEFANGDDPNTLFSSSEAIQLLYCSLCSAKTSQGHPAMLVAQESGDIDSVLALHDHVSLHQLRGEWSKLPLQPLPEQHIADYFGPSVALYFDDLQFYTQYLFAPAFLGAGIAAYNEMMADDGTTISDFADTWTALIWTLFVSIWATMFVAQWRHRVKVSRHRLGLKPVTGKKTVHDLSASRFYFDSLDLVVKEWTVQPAVHIVSSGQGLGMFSYVLMAFGMMAILGSSTLVVGVLLWIGDQVEMMYSNIVVQNLPVILYLAVVGGLQVVYERIAFWLTNLEKSLLHGVFMRSYIIKTSAFHILNYLSWFVYLALWKQDLNYLRSQLLVFFTVKQVLGNILETGVPWLKSFIQQPRGSTAAALAASKAGNVAEVPHLLRAAVEAEWQKEEGDLGADYLEIAVLFATATWFAPVFPLGMPLALLHVVTEAASDRFKLCTATRRPLRKPSNFILQETWLDVFEALSYIGVVVSVMTIAVTGSWNAWHIVAIEHALLFGKLFLGLTIPHEPEWLAAHRVREAHQEGAAGDD
eukprot:TRINITY_DN100556_c0_g1_i1.p1 TRINITY_DN100556_c0_g1~~TRINITY_DN100556_c0_g1_i1.p1  ORF type:complete len:841 (-),score=139.40 TRINITY_DN100556_c0_g1_i1:57-2504(-)